MFGLWLKTIAALAILTGCANPLMQSSSTKSSSKAKMIEVPLQVVNRSSARLNLAGSEILEYTMTVTHCSSGWKRTIADNNPILGTAPNPTTVALYQKDVDCLVGLKSFKVGEVTYESGADEGLTESTDIFTGDDDSEVRVTVISNISDAISATSEAVFAYAEIVGADGTYDIDSYSESAELSIQGVEAPNVSISGMSIFSISQYEEGDETTGVATFTVTIKCEGDTAGNAPNHTCETAKDGFPQLINGMSLSLVTDDFVAPIDFDDAEAAFANASTDVTASEAVTGGIGAVVEEVAATHRLWTHKDMVLFVRYQEEIGTGGQAQTIASYRYFRVSIGDPQ